MPESSWSPKRERQYKHIKESYKSGAFPMMRPRNEPLER